MSSLKKLAGETAIYGLPAILGRAINFLLVPFYTNTDVLSVEEYGITAEVYGYVAISYIIYTYGMETAFFRFVSKHQSNAKHIYNNVLTLLFSSSVALSALLIYFAKPISVWMEIPGKENIIIIMAVVMAIDAFVAIPFALLRYEKKALKFSGIKLFNIFLNVGLNLFFLVLCKRIYLEGLLPALKPAIARVYTPELNVEYIFIANLLANSSYLFLLAKEILRARPELKLSVIKPMLQYGIPIGLMGIATVINDKFNLVLFPKILPDNFYPDLNAKEANGILNAALKLAMIMTLSVQAFKYAAEPFFFAQQQKENAKDSYSRLFFYFVLFGSFTILATSLNLEIIKIPILRDPTYYRALVLVPILLTANFFLGLSYNFSVWYKVTDKTIFGTYIAIGGAALTFIGNFWAVPRYGYHGTAWVIFTVYLFIMSATYLTGRRHYKVNYPIKKALIWFTFAIALTVIGLNLPIHNKVLLQTIKELLVLFYLVLAFWLVIKNKPVKQNIN